jgi:AcrR family transcriptional regulator
MPDYRRPLQDRAKRTFDGLLDAAADLLGEVGVERISANLICERAGVTPPAFYRYFDDKQAIVVALAERLMERQNVVLEAWVARYRDSGLDLITDKVIELLRELHVVTAGTHGALWTMRALRAMPRLTDIRLQSHNYVADVLTDIYTPYLPHVPRDLVRRRTRMSVEMAYALDEMLKEGEADPEALFEDAALVFRSMLTYPEYGLFLPLTPAPGRAAQDSVATTESEKSAETT